MVRSEIIPLTVAGAIVLAAGWEPNRTAALAQVARLTARVRTIEADPIEGTLVEFSLRGGAVVTSGTRKSHIPVERIIHIETAANDSRVLRESALRSARSREKMLFDLVDGDWVVAAPVGFAAERCRLALASGAELSVPLEAITSIQAAEVASTADQVLGSPLESTAGDQDRVLLRNGDIVAGFIERIDADGFTLDNAMGTVTVPLRLVVAARMAPAPRRPLPEQYARVHIAAGGRLTCRAVELSGLAFNATYVHGDLVGLRPTSIARIEVIGGKWTPLSTLRPLTYEHTPMLALHWEYTRNSNVLGGPLKVAGQTFESGLGVHSRSRVSYELKGQFSEFVTRFGVDDSAGPLADVDATILVDGTTRFERKGITRGKLSEKVRVDVRHASRIELVVDFGRNGDVQDRFNWIEPGLIR